MSDNKSIDKIFSFNFERIQTEFLMARDLFEKYKIKNTVAIFGSARARIDDKRSKKYYEAAYNLANRLATWSKQTYLPDTLEKFYICTGGGGGIMGAANHGAFDAGEKNLGLNIVLPREQMANPHITKELCITFNYFFVRKFWLINLAEAFVIFPGGFGTCDELFEVLTLLQTHKAHKAVPVVFFGKKFFSEVLNTKMLEKSGYISKDDKKLFILTDSIDEAFNYITTNLKRN